MVIVTANGSRVRALGTVNALPINLQYMIIPTDIHVLESQDKVLILGNDWLRKVDARIDWKNEELTLRAKGRTICVPIMFTLEKAYIATEANESDDEFEDEELEEAYVYFSDHNSVSSECSYESSEEDLEFNPWVNAVLVMGWDNVYGRDVQDCPVHGHELCNVQNMSRTFYI